MASWSAPSRTVEQALVRRRFQESVEAKQALLADEYIAFTADAAALLVGCFRAGGKVLFCGNGGSASDAMHLAAEFVGRYLFDRPALPAVSLADNQAAVTCIGNDYGQDEIFARVLRAYARTNDVLIALSTSGNSPNVLAAVAAARELDVTTIGMTGTPGGALAGVVDLSLRVPSEQTPRIQEGHMLVGHTICELVEAALFT